MKHEYRVLRQLDGVTGIPKVHWFGYEARYNALILDFLGPSLEDVFNSCCRSFSLNTIVLIADQLVSPSNNYYFPHPVMIYAVQICRLQDIHTRDLIHRDLKPRNILIGAGNNAHIIYLVDFGLSKQYRDPNTHIHITPGHTTSFIGTPAFASINSHLRLELGRRDDLESLVYLLMYLVRGFLPWMDRKITSDAMVLDMKRDMDELCRELPHEFRHMLDYLRGLAFHAKPNYDYLRALIRKIPRSSEVEDALPDWLLKTKSETNVLHQSDTTSTALQNVELCSQL